MKTQQLTLRLIYFSLVLPFQHNSSRFSKGGDRCEKSAVGHPSGEEEQILRPEKHLDATKRRQGVSFAMFYAAEEKTGQKPRLKALPDGTHAFDRILCRNCRVS